VRILVVDDSSAVRARLVSLLAEQPGVTSLAEAATGEDALMHIRAHRPDVVVLDLQLPVMSGLELLSAFRAEPRPCFIVLSNNAEPQYRREANARGADHFFDKSTEFDRVVPVVAELINHG